MRSRTHVVWLVAVAIVLGMSSESTTTGAANSKESHRAVSEQRRVARPAGARPSWLKVRDTLSSSAFDVDGTRDIGRTSEQVEARRQLDSQVTSVAGVNIPGAWSALGLGMNDWVEAVAVYNGQLIAAGSFTTAGGAPANYVAAWNGSSWAPLGSGMNGEVYALAVYDGKLIAGGYFSTAGGVTAYFIAAWNGSSWSALGSSVNNTVAALTVYNNQLIAGGYFTNAGGVSANRLAAWNGSSWSALGTGTDKLVRALTVYNTQLIAAGCFTSAGGTPANYVASWNGASWSPLGSGVGDTVYALSAYDTKLYIGGGFTTAGGASANYIAAWNGSSWSPLGSGTSHEVYVLSVYDDQLTVGGRFSSAGGDYDCDCIASWDGSSWSPLGKSVDNTVTALTTFDTRLIAGGFFSTAGSVSANKIAAWLPNGCPTDLSAIPNPVNATVGVLASSTVTGIDPEADPLEFYLVAPSKGDIDSLTGVWEYTPIQSDIPGFDVTVEVSDDQHHDDPCQTITFHVNVSTPINQCPVNVTAAPNPVNAQANVPASATVSATDPESDPIQYYLVSGQGSVSSVTGAWSYTPVCADIPGFDVTMKASDRGASECASSTVTFHVNVAQPYSCAQSGTDPYLLACPKGDIPFEVHLRKTDGSPATTICNLSDVYLDFTSCSASEFFPKPGTYSNWPRVYAPTQPDANGTIRFAIAAGGDCVNCNVFIYAGCGLIAAVPVRSVDVDGDSVVTPLDYDLSQGTCRDFNADGQIDDADLTRFTNHFDHRFSQGNCDWLAQTIELAPDMNLRPGQQVYIRYRVDNNPSGGTCRVDSVEIYQSAFTTDPGTGVTTLRPNQTLPAGASYTDSLLCTVPADSGLCVRTVLYSDCCTTPPEQRRCIDLIQQCPPKVWFYEFKSHGLAMATERHVFHSIPTDQGWTFDTVWTWKPDTSLVVITTSNQTDPGTTGSVRVLFRVGGSNFYKFVFAVRQGGTNGDLCGGPGGTVDCQANIQDVACLINLIFRGSMPPIPDPAEHGDVNCDHVFNIVDVVQLVNYVFRGGDLLPDCGAGPTAQ